MDREFQFIHQDQDRIEDISSELIVEEFCSKIKMTITTRTKVKGTLNEN